MGNTGEILVPHIGWLRHESGDDVALFLRQGWFEAREQAMLWLYLREGDVFIDCGAHVGLFGCLAGRAVGSGGSAGRVIAIEPAPATAGLLRENLAANEAPNVTVVEAGVADHAGSMMLHRLGEGGSAYNTLSGEDSEAGVGVRVLTMDQLLDEQQVERADFLKLDVEGFELSVWQGAKRSIERGALPVVMIEFTEQNLQRAGHSTLELAKAVEDSGYTLCRFDIDLLQLSPTTVTEPIGYDNLFAVRNLADANARLAGADEDRRRIAAEILYRAAAAQVAQEAETIKRHAAETEQLTEQRIERMTRDLRQIIARAEHSEKAHEQTGATLRQTQQWLQATKERAITAERRAESAEAREKRLAEQLEETRELVRNLRSQLFAFVTSKYEQLSWKAGIRKKPDWVDGFIEFQSKEIGK